ncbi:WXG100 family type VII secretion target [Brachybacterium rhamnosum]
MRGEGPVNATQGMNVEEVRRMANQLRDAAEEITRIEQELTSGLEEVDWTGPDADRFRGEWSGEMVPALQQVMKAVEELGQTADSNAAEQEATSS